MLPSAVNDTMRDMMAQIRDCGDGIRDGTYTMTAPKITGGTITGVAFTGNTFTSPVITGGSINNTPIGATTANTGAFTTLSATGVTTVQAGTVSAPAITTSGDTNTGIFFPAADTIAFTEGGVESMRIDSSGNVGIGTASPNITAVGTALTLLGSSTNRGNLEIGSTSAGTSGVFGQISFYNGANQNTLIQSSTDGTNADSGLLRFYTKATAGVITERMRIDSSGNVGIGTSSPTFGSGGGLQVKNASDSNLRLTSGTFTGFDIQQSSTGLAYLYNRDNTSMIFGTNNAERMRIDSSGNVLVGATATSNNAKFFVTGSVADRFVRFTNSQPSAPFGVVVEYSAAAPNDTGKSFLFCSDNSATRADIRSNGGLANYSGNNVNLSDAREKTNVELAGYYLNKICSIPVKTFNYIDQNREEDDGLTLGVIAQDVQAVAPELVSESDWGTKDEPKMRLSIYQTDLQYALMKSIQELKAELDSVKAELQTLKGN
jgi:hypothetical protein